MELPVSRALAIRYAALVESGAITEDSAQLAAVRKLDALNEHLAEVRLASKKSALGWLFARKKNEMWAAVRGLYLWGGVGRGKTMLMDLFMEVTVIRRKRRVHFHEFMAETHERIHAWRQALKNGEVKGDDPIPPVADQIALETRLLCFDEFTVTDIADAMILGRLFTQLFARGVIVVATSNVAPENLYKDGLNRQLFLPFIALLGRHVEVLKLDSPTDYRLEKLGGAEVYMSPLGPETSRAFDDLWRGLTHGMPEHAEHLDMKGRRIEVPRVASGVARFSFADLCARPLGAADYLRIAQAYGTVFIENVPAMDLSRRNEAKRFINLIDAFYDNGVKTVISAETEPDGLYRAASGTEMFEFDRTISRLIEMRSEAYLAGENRSSARADMHSH
ncbi:cell division protein ZapE [Microvirga tunisiensis]|uniref:Cell division protein ZapE n=2 Tax=Pannonibacter tanglangensis TaxID=2750084 RepID=A0ABW9ZJF1_9HYPH|nr:MULTISPECIES: cell division protein ZapE [unclassified Pannonibacter]NBN65014.1 cell division protein ZapE [Pannonibacter sp. XCT-34]NBN79523.1 cell division protein ZapE [Pannonibacter sp. XCT-53]